MKREFMSISEVHPEITILVAASSIRTKRHPNNGGGLTIHSDVVSNSAESE